MDRQSSYHCLVWYGVNRLWLVSVYIIYNVFIYTLYNIAKRNITRILQLLLCSCAAINFHLRSSAEYAQTVVQKALAWEISCKHGRGTTNRYFAFRTRWSPRGFLGYFIIVYYCNYFFIMIILLYFFMLYVIMFSYYYILFYYTACSYIEHVDI